MNNEQQLHQVEISIEQAKKMIDNSQSLAKLHDNEDFKKVILEGFFKIEASRTVMLRADPNSQDEEKQKDIDNIITSIGGLYQYFHKVFTLGTMAEQSLEADQQTHGDLLQEDLAMDGIEGTVQ